MGANTFLYAQLLNSSGPLLDACPLPNWGGQMEPVYPAAARVWAAGAAGTSPVDVQNVSSLGWRPPLPATELTLLAELTVSDGLLLSLRGIPANATQRASVFLELYAAMLPLVTPATTTQVKDWSAVAAQSERDLRRADGAMVTYQGQQLLRSYWNDGRAGAESVTQFSVLEPMRRWNHSCALHTTLTASLKAISFYHPEIGCIADSPAVSIMNNGSVLDGW